MSVVLLSDAPSSSTLDFSKYDGFLGSLGVVYHHTAETRPTSQTLQLRPTRQDTGLNSDEVRPESGDIFSQSDFRGGMGQTRYHVKGSDEAKTRYYFSKGFDISQEGKLRHARAFEIGTTVHDTVLALSVHNNTLFAVANPDALPGAYRVIRHSGSFPPTWTEENPYAGEAVTGTPGPQSLVSSDYNMYLALGTNGIHRRDLAGTWTHYSDANVNMLAYAKERLIGAKDDGGGLYEITTSGVAPAPFDTLPAGYTARSIFTLGAYIYVVATMPLVYGRGRIYHYGLNSAGTALERKGTTEFPAGDTPYHGVGYLNVALVTTYRLAEAGGAAAYVTALYRAVPDENGFLSYVLEAESRTPSAGVGQDFPGPMVSGGSEVSIAWNDTNDSFQGIARYDLVRGGLSLQGAVRRETWATQFYDASIYRGQRILGDNNDLYYENLNKYEQTATLITSMADWNNAGLKSWTDIQISHKPLPIGASVAVYYTTVHPDENNWTLAGTSNIAGSTGAKFAISGVVARTFALKFVSTRGTDVNTAPEISGYSVRSNPKPEATEWVLSRTIRVLSKDQKDDGGAEIRQNPKTTRDAILATAYSTTTLYESDATWSVRVEAIRDVKPVLAKGTSTGGNVYKEGYFLELQMIGTKTT